MAKLSNEIVVFVGAERITLTPRLRHAMRLERREGGFQRLMRELSEESLTAAYAVLEDFIEITPERRLAIFAVLSEIRWPLVFYVAACAGIEEEDVPAKGKKADKTVTFAEHLTDLYRIGTGWLGWTPEDTLNATPQEIRLAYEGRMEMLKSIFGSDEKSKSDAPATPEQLAEKMKFIMRGRAAAGKGK